MRARRHSVPLRMAAPAAFDRFVPLTERNVFLTPPFFESCNAGPPGLPPLLFATLLRLAWRNSRPPSPPPYGRVDLVQSRRLHLSLTWFTPSDARQIAPDFNLTVASRMARLVKSVIVTASGEPGRCKWRAIARRRNRPKRAARLSPGRTGD